MADLAACRKRMATAAAGALSNDSDDDLESGDGVADDDVGGPVEAKREEDGDNDSDAGDAEKERCEIARGVSGTATLQVGRHVKVLPA